MDDELTEAQREELVGDLKALRQLLTESKAASAELAVPVELDQAAVGRVSRIDAIQQQQMAGAQVRRSELRLKQVAVAMKAVEDDDFGWCKMCGEPIGYRRLKARPESPCCVECMSQIGG